MQNSQVSPVGSLLRPSFKPHRWIPLESDPLNQIESKFNEVEGDDVTAEPQKEPPEAYFGHQFYFLALHFCGIAYHLCLLFHD